MRMEAARLEGYKTCQCTAVKTLLAAFDFLNIPVKVSRDSF